MVPVQTHRASTFEGTYRTRTTAWLSVSLWCALLVAAIASLTVGRYSINVTELAGAAWHLLTGEGIEQPKVESVLMGVRLPRTILAIVIGGGLAVAGATFQSVFSNPLATPDTLGVAAGTSLGAVCALLMNWNLIGVQVLALVFGLGAMALSVGIARQRDRISIIMLVLAGVVVSAIANAGISLVKMVADPTSKLPEITYWLLGSMAGVGFEQMSLGVPLIISGSIVIYMLRWRLNILALSEDEARAAGINLNVIRPLAIVASTAITASVVSMCGQIGWVGLLVPHCARMLVGHNNRVVIPVSLLLGSAMMLAIDLLSRSLTASEIPLSVLTALLGAPIFIILLRRTGGNWQ